MINAIACFNTTSRSPIIFNPAFFIYYTCICSFGDAKMVGTRKLVVDVRDFEKTAILLKQLLMKYDNILLRRRKELQEHYVEVKAWGRRK